MTPRDFMFFFIILSFILLFPMQGCLLLYDLPLSSCRYLLATLLWKHHIDSQLFPRDITIKLCLCNQPEDSQVWPAISRGIIWGHCNHTLTFHTQVIINEHGVFYMVVASLRLAWASSLQLQLWDHCFCWLCYYSSLWYYLKTLLNN